MIVGEHPHTLFFESFSIFWESEMNTTKFSVALSLGIFLAFQPLASANAGREGPCKPKAEAKHEARKTLHSCVEAWAKDRNPNDSDPGDDCSQKLSSFIQAAKDVKACRAEQKK